MSTGVPEQHHVTSLKALNLALWGKHVLWVWPWESAPPTVDQTACMPGVCTCTRYCSRTMVEAVQVSKPLNSHLHWQVYESHYQCMTPDTWFD